MAVTLNAKGTSIPYFTIGKQGTTLFQGSSDPAMSCSPKNGDVWFNSSTHALETWSSVLSDWQAPRLADLNFSNSVISAGTNASLTLKTSPGYSVILDAGPGSATLTTTTGDNLNIRESIGGSLYLNSSKWPSADGTSGQVLYTNGSGTLGWKTVVNSVSGTTNQVTVSTSTGNVTFSIPSTFVAPGSIQFTTNFGYASETIAASGTTSATATVISKSYSIVTTANALYGVRLPTPTFNGQYHIITNCTNSLQFFIYPSTGSAFTGTAVDTPTFLTVDQTTMFIWDGTDWHPMRSIITPGNTGITVDNQQGTVFISNNGVLSFSGGTTGLTPATSTNGNITLDGILSIGAGGTNATSPLAGFNNLSPLTTTGDLLSFSAGSNVRVPIGTSTQVLSVVSGTPSWISQSTMSVGSATTAVTSTNLANGATGSVPYQTASGTTSFIGIGSPNQVLSVVSGVPTWQSVTTSLGYTPINKAGDTMSGDLNLDSHKVTNLAAPTQPGDAATKAYVDAASGGLTILEPVKIAQLVDLTTIGNGSSGPIATLGTITGGSGYTNGTYNGISLSTNNIGGGATANITVSGGTVTAVTIVLAGSRYDVGDVLYADETLIGGTGTGFSVPVATVSSNWGTVTYTAGSSDQNGGTGVGATLVPTNNGMFVLDSYAFSAGDRVLIKAQTTQTQNGIYVVTNAGSALTKWLLTRASDYNDSVINQVTPGTYVFITEGHINKNSSWVQTTIGTSSVPGAKTGAIVIGTDSIVFTQFSASQDYTAGTGLSLIGNEFSNTGVLSVTTNTGLSTNVSAIGNITITNTGVTAITAGSGINVSGSTGSVTISAATQSIQNKSANYTILSTDGTIFANASAGAITITLPATPTVGEMHTIKKVDNTRLAVTLSGNGHNIDNYSTVLMNIPYMSLDMLWNATTNTWQII